MVFAFDVADRDLRLQEPLQELLVLLVLVLLADLLDEIILIEVLLITESQ